MSGVLVYLYGFVPAGTAAPPVGLRGLEGGAVRIVGGDAVSAAVGEVPASEYSGARMDAHLADLAWVGERGLAHDRVLGWFAGGGAVVPVAPFSLHSGEEGVRRLLAEQEVAVAALLERLSGCTEWGVRLWSTPETSPRVEQQAPELAALREEIAGAAPGRRFLLEKKRGAAVREAVQGVSARLAREVLDALRGHAEASHVRSVPPLRESARILLLDAVFLVAEAGFGEFSGRVRALAEGAAEQGFHLELTGPWPPYHFVGG
jgi:hypothetical protein